jgi:hypothetical protein
MRRYWLSISIAAISVAGVAATTAPGKFCRVTRDVCP